MAKRRILVIPGYNIYPIKSGGAHGQLTFLEKQQYLFHIHLILTPDNIKFSDIPAFKKKFPEIEVIPIGTGKKNKNKKGIKAFMIKQIRKFSGKDFSYLMRKVNHINGFFINNPDIIDELRSYVNNNLFDLIQVEHLRNAGLITILPSSVKRIFVQHEVGFLRVRDDIKFLGYPASYADYLSGFAEGAEIYWMRQYDGIITFNNDDLRLLRSKGVELPVQVASPFALFDDELKKIYNPSISPNLLFIGGEDHYPNEQGLTWFIENVFPLILKKNKGIVLSVTSEWSDEYKRKYANANVKFTGFLDDLDDLLASSILITPIHIGSGIRVKVFTSMAKGLPIVATALGASGIPELEHKKNILLADNATEFSDNIIDLVESEILRKKISEGAYDLSLRNFAAMKFVEERNKFYEKLWQANSIADN